MTEVRHAPNRSMPPCSVIPVLAYPDVEEAVSWLCDRFGFGLRWRVGDHRAQISIGDGAVVIVGGGSRTHPDEPMMIRIEDVDLHYLRVVDLGVEVTAAPASHPYGERQYTAIDLAGRHWTFSQTVADVDPTSWGAVTGEALD